MAFKIRPFYRFIRDILRLERRERNTYQSGITWVATDYLVAGFGGDIMAQSLETCRLTLDPRFHLHSMSCNFIRPRIPKDPVFFDVSRLRDGNAFSSLTVNAQQNGECIFVLQGSFHDEANQSALDNFTWFPEMPQVAMPESLATVEHSLQQIRETSPSELENSDIQVSWFRNAQQDLSMDMKFVDTRSTRLAGKGASKKDQTWIRMKEDLGSNQNLHRSALAYCSDIHMCVGPTRQLPNKLLSITTLSHSMWIHRDINMNDWNLLEINSRVMSNSRGLSDGLLWNRSGELVASLSQEALVRKKKLQK